MCVSQTHTLSASYTHSCSHPDSLATTESRGLIGCVPHNERFDWLSGRLPPCQLREHVCVWERETSVFDMVAANTQWKRCSLRLFFWFFAWDLPSFFYDLFKIFSRVATFFLWIILSFRFTNFMSHLNVTPAPPFEHSVTSTCSSAALLYTNSHSACIFFLFCSFCYWLCLFRFTLTPAAAVFQLTLRSYCCCSHALFHHYELSQPCSWLFPAVLLHVQPCGIQLRDVCCLQILYKALTFILVVCFFCILHNKYMIVRDSLSSLYTHSCALRICDGQSAEKSHRNILSLAET